MYTIDHSVRINYKKITCDCNIESNPCSNCQTLTTNYILGKAEPHYPVPAIRQGWEPMHRLNDDAYVWVHWHQGVYED